MFRSIRNYFKAVSFRYRVGKGLAVRTREFYKNGNAMLLGELEDLEVVVEHPFVQENGFKFAMCGMEAKRITVDEYFMASPEYVQDFILEHEYGHIALGHEGLTAATRTELLKAGEASEEEYEADEYAAKVVGFDQAIKALEFMQWLFPKNEELRLRIRNLTVMKALDSEMEDMRVA